MSGSCWAWLWLFLQQRAVAYSSDAELTVRATYARGTSLLAGPQAEARVIKGLLSYSAAIHAAVPSRQMALSEFAWRNGFFLACLAAARRGDACSRQLVSVSEAGTGPDLQAEGCRATACVPGKLCVHGMQLRDVAHWLQLGDSQGCCHTQTLHEAWLARAGLDSGQSFKLLSGCD